MLGLSEIVVIGIIALIFIGPKELPEVARTIARFLNELRRATGSLAEEFKNSKNHISDQILNPPPIKEKIISENKDQDAKPS